MTSIISKVRHNELFFLLIVLFFFKILVHEITLIGNPMVDKT